MKTNQVEESFLVWASPFVCFLALLGIPAAGFVVLALSTQIPRFFYGQANPLLGSAEIGALTTVIVLLFALRACLKLPSAPGGFYRNILDFLAMARWHPAVKIALVGLLVLPPVWFFRGGHSALPFLWKLGWRRALLMSDVRDDLDRLTIAFELSLMGGVPLLFCLHMLSRWKPQMRILPWVLVPVLFVGTAIAIVIVGTIFYMAQ